MTRAESSEIFIYDLAVHSDHRRKSVARYLLNALCEQASEAGIREVVVAADNDDVHALAFIAASEERHRRLQFSASPMWSDARKS